MRRKALRFLYAAQKAVFKIRNPIILGAHAIVLRESHVLLVRLSYYGGWFLPGGTVERGESFESAVRRELLEECGIHAHDTKLLGLYLNRRENKITHIGIYVVPEFSGEPSARDNLEIEEVRFFPITALPEELWAGHRRRIEEFQGSRRVSADW